MTRGGVARTIRSLSAQDVKKPSEPSDLGLELVKKLHDRLQIDPEWCLWDKRGFTWWGKNLAQRVWAEPARKDSEGEVFQRLHAQSDVFDGFDGSDGQVQLLNLLNTMATLGAFVPKNDGSGRVCLCTSMLLYADNESFVWLVFATAAAMQAAEAVITCSWLDDNFRNGLVDAVTHHPKSGERHLPDQMLEFIDQSIRPQGEGTSRYAGEAMETLAKEMLRPPCLFASGDKTGVTAEYPHPKHSYLVRLMTEEKHPRMGAGLLTTLNLPEGDNGIESARAALAMNGDELFSGRTHQHFVGAWCATVRGLAFNAFFPNAMANDGIPLSVAGNMVRRARWHSDTVHKFDWVENFASSMNRYMERLKKIGLGEF